jgi:hypothetical protein
VLCRLHFFCFLLYRRSDLLGKSIIIWLLRWRSQHRPVYEFHGQTSLELDAFLDLGSGVSRCIQHPPRIPSQLEMRELGTGVILLFSLNVATITATIFFFLHGWSVASRVLCI